MTWAWLATKAMLRSHSSLYTEPFPPSTSPGTFQSIQTAFFCLVNEWNRLFQRLSAAQMHSRDNWAPLSRRSFDLSLKTDVALLFLFFQYALPSMGDAKDVGHLVIITQWFQLAEPLCPLLNQLACLSKMSWWHLGHMLWLWSWRGSCEPPLPFLCWDPSWKTCCFNISQIKTSFNQKPDRYGCQGFL